MNINEQGESIPVNVRILTLSSRNLFDREVRDFDALWRDPVALLDDELLSGPQEYAVLPRGERASPERLPFLIDLPEETEYVAILALFHTDAYETVRRYRLVPIEEVEQNVVRLTQARIELVTLDE